MIRIALVEDDPVYREQLQNYLTQFGQQSGEKLAVTVFDDGDEIALNYKAEYDIILMDIEMKFMDGMTAAEMIRQKDDQVVIIFITNSPQYAIKGYAVDALDYVLKPVPYFAFSQQLQKAVKRLKRMQRAFLAVPVEGGMRRVSVDSIYYLESEGHSVHFYTESGDFPSPGTLKSFETQLSGKSFARCNSGYLVNLAQVTGVQQNVVQVGPYELQISRPKKKSFLEALTDYIGGEVK